MQRYALVCFDILCYALICYGMRYYNLICNAMFSYAKRGCEKCKKIIVDVVKCYEMFVNALTSKVENV